MGSSSLDALISVTRPAHTLSVCYKIGLDEFKLFHHFKIFTNILPYVAFIPDFTHNKVNASLMYTMDIMHKHLLGLEKSSRWEFMIFRFHS